MIGLGLRWSKTRNNDPDTQQVGSDDQPESGSLNEAPRAALAAQSTDVATQSAHEPNAPGPGSAQNNASPSAANQGAEAINQPATGAPTLEGEHGPASSQPPDLAPSSPATPSVAAPAEAHALTARLQTVLGNRFLVQKPIAIGGMATIFLLRHRLHGGLFVAKVLHPELVGKPGVVAGFRMEAAYAAQLGNHPNAVPVFDFGEGEDLFYLLMPYIDGADLDRVLLKAGPLSREETLQIAAQISSLLCHAESLDIVHGDLTPGNIRLDIYGQYRLLDLGISQARGPQDRPYASGTPLYNSPEQLLGQPLDTRSDLYSLGSVLCECLSNRPAFHADTLEAIHARHRAGDWQMPETVHEADPLRLLLTKLLSVDPAGRPQSAYELSGILHALGWARPEFRPTPPGLDPFMKAPGGAPRKRLSS